MKIGLGFFLHFCCFLLKVFYNLFAEDFRGRMKDCRVEQEELPTPLIYRDDILIGNQILQSLALFSTH